MPKDARRETSRSILIEATLDAIAEVGLSRTSIHEIVSRARLSRGMVNLYFDSKDALLVAAAKQSYESYYDTLQNRLQTAIDQPQQVIRAVVLNDLDADTLNGRTVKIWFAFRSTAHAHADIARYSDTRDGKLRGMILTAFLEIARQEGSCDVEQIAHDATHGLLALLEGMWTDYLLHIDVFDRETAARTVFRFLSALFPEHFCLADGEIV